MNHRQLSFIRHLVGGVLLLALNHSGHTSDADQVPTTRWNIMRADNVRWGANLGTQCLAPPVITDGLVWIGTNNENPRDPRYSEPAGVLMCFRESDGEFLYQHVSPARQRVQ